MSRLKLVCYTLSALVLTTTSFPLFAQFPAEAWGTDNCLYVAQNGAWVKSQACRRFPDPRNVNQWDLFSQGTAFYRFTVNGGQIVMYHYASRTTFVAVNRGSISDALQQHISALQQVAQAQQTQAAVAVPGPCSNLNALPKYGCPAEQNQVALANTAQQTLRNIAEAQGTLGDEQAKKAACEAAKDSGSFDRQHRGRPWSFAANGRDLGDPCP